MLIKDVGAEVSHEKREMLARAHGSVKLRTFKSMVSGPYPVVLTSAFRPETNG